MALFSFRSVACGIAVALLAVASSCAGDGRCRYNSDCQGAYCDNGACKKDCVDAALDCPRGFICSAIARCEVPPGAVVGPDGGIVFPPASDGGPVVTPDSGTPGTDAAADGSISPPLDAGLDTGKPPLKKVLLDACGGDSECASGLCKPYFVGGGRRCTKTCVSTPDCMQGTRCIEFGAAGSWCVFSDIGRTCNVAGDCSFACLTSQKYCTAKCTTGSDCPNGYGCQAVGTPPTSVCVKNEAACGPGMTGACIAPAACDNTMLVSSCTQACGSAADCPQRAQGLAPWTCNGLCKRPADVVGPLAGGEPAEYACQGGSIVNLCNDAQHMNFDTFTIPPAPVFTCPVAVSKPGAAGDTCVDSCRYQGACIHGFHCTGIGSVGANRIGLCLPGLGGGEVGAACTRSADCYFGHCNLNTNKCSRDCTVDGLCPTGSACSAGATPAVEGRLFRRCE